MRKQLFLLVSLTLCLALSACGGEERISGEVVEITPEAIILETDEGKRVAVLLEEETYVFGTDGIEGEAYKAAPHTGVRVTAFQPKRAGSVSTADGTQLKVYRSDHDYISIDAYLVSEAAVLSDGTVLDAWKTSAFGTTYQTEDGVELLREDAPNGPENHYVVNLESFDDLSEEAKPRVRAFYQQQGKLYDLQEELERAWAAYQTDPAAFASFWVMQDSYPAASSERVFYFGTSLTRTLSGNIGQETTRCAAFDRENGDLIPLADLFLCPEKELGKTLLDLAEQCGGGPSDPALKGEMERAFQMEYLSFHQDNLCLEFPQGSLPSQKNAYLVTVDFTEGCRAILHPWAVPEQRD